MYAYFTPISYQVNLNVGAGGKASSSSINVSYGLTNTFTVTPNKDYYLENISCTNGYTVSGYSTGENETKTQTVTVANNNKLSGSTCTISFKYLCPYPVGTVWNFDYTGGEQKFEIPGTGTYKLEVWGAAGGSITGYSGGLGGYSKGTVNLTRGENVYINVGGAGGSCYQSGNAGGGYNGGGTSYCFFELASGYDCTTYHYNNEAGGGGATHIAKRSGQLRNLVSYQNEVLLVAGGGGGAHRETVDSVCEVYNVDSHDIGGSGGGLTSGTGTNHHWITSGSTQIGSCSTGRYATGGFGYGADASVTVPAGGGGGGWYGGCIGYADGGAGGSGYIGGVTNSSTQNGVRTGNGYARITLVSLTP